MFRIGVLNTEQEDAMFFSDYGTFELSTLNPIRTDSSSKRSGRVLQHSYISLLSRFFRLAVFQSFCY